MPRIVKDLPPWVRAAALAVIGALLGLGLKVSADTLTTHGKQIAGNTNAIADHEPKINSLMLRAECASADIGKHGERITAVETQNSIEHKALKDNQQLILRKLDRLFSAKPTP